MKLQKQLSRKVGNTAYSKWIITLPPKIIKTTGWKAGQELRATIEDNKVILEGKKKEE